MDCRWTRAGGRRLATIVRGRIVGAATLPDWLTRTGLGILDRSTPSRCRCRRFALKAQLLRRLWRDPRRVSTLALSTAGKVQTHAGWFERVVNATVDAVLQIDLLLLFFLALRRTFHYPIVILLLDEAALCRPRPRLLRNLPPLSRRGIGSKAGRSTVESDEEATLAVVGVVQIGAARVGHIYFAGLPGHRIFFEHRPSSELAIRFPEEEAASEKLSMQRS